MSGSQNSDISPAAAVQNILRNWEIKNEAEILPVPLQPEREADPAKWGQALQQLVRLSDISPGQSRDVYTKLRAAIMRHRHRNTTKAGKVNWVTVTDIKAVMRQLDAIPKPKEEEGPTLPESMAPPKRLQTPSNNPDEDEDEEVSKAEDPNLSDNSVLIVKDQRRPPRRYSGAHFLQKRVPKAPFKSNFDAAPPRSPGLRKRTRNLAMEEEEAPPSKRVSLEPGMHNREYEDPGFLSDLGDPIGEGPSRLSRLEVRRGEDPHWLGGDQGEMGPQSSGHETPQGLPAGALPGQDHAVDRAATPPGDAAALEDEAVIGPGDSASQRGGVNALTVGMSSISFYKQHPFPENATTEDKLGLFDKLADIESEIAAEQRHLADEQRRLAEASGR
ncbi:hypothetical protein BDV95DRAFT_608389 [Massariosphaeria phaeospora]|uniref:Uncharacterized protein n=1 Tax=Massariosphaeria phaeospora TaxID=100035 RepID=A0A7C8I7W8_9PLEO|nr:hypothetical protein BDV95DRAFT_608389 [Massariosphaeria phaeospora]